MDFPEPFGPRAFDPLRTYLANLLNNLPEMPRAILMISAHWEEALPTFNTSASPPMLYDYYGFPEHTYGLNYPAPGSPELAARAAALLNSAGIATATNEKRGFDHGVFVPMLIVDPDATIPLVSLSLQRGLDPERHIAIGAALAPLRDDGVLIIGSGNSYHNLSHFFDGSERSATAFDNWLDETVSGTDPKTRNAKLTDWTRAPSARACHPREEHLLPLMVAAGAGNDAVGKRTLAFTAGGKAISCFTFGQN
jgi:aromatic ring-opening dioxygenase catalytic subunit (LigB family)